MLANQPTLDLDTEDDRRWAAVTARDVGQDGAFWYAVATTGVYCRPSCKSRRAKRANVAFFASPKEAEAAGYRPCKRCRPDLSDPEEPAREQILAACRSIEAALDAGEPAPGLERLAAGAGLSASHFQRTFKAVAGLSPAAYGRALRDQRARQGLNGASSVTEAAFDAGYGSLGRFYEGAGKALGMNPAAYRNRGARGAKRETIRYALRRSSMGETLIAGTDKGVCCVMFGDDAKALENDLQERFANAELALGDDAFEELAAQALAVVDGQAPAAGLPLDVRGTAFQQRVWDELTRIPAGKTASYAEVARAIGEPGASRAVARACAGNKIAVAIPCHRVVRADGSLSGYRWGVERKAALLEREKSLRER